VTRWRSVLLLPALLALLVGCNPSISPPQFRQPDPSLVTAADLAPCPVAGKPVKGGLPNLTLHCLDGKSTLNLAGLRGPALINVWYSTCEPCQKESPYLEQFRDLAQDKVLVLGVDAEPQPNAGLTFDSDHGLHYASVSDQHLDVAAKLKMAGYPMSYFLDAAGELVGKPQILPFASVAQVKAAVKSHLGITVP
jgi:cytochrome c biogenesis protein CcmG, thiol:disulfide interchange protein DsbE